MDKQRFELTSCELDGIFEVRSELMTRGLNRKYPQKQEWLASKRPDGDIVFTAGVMVRVMPQMKFYHLPSIVDVWDHVEKYWQLEAPIQTPVSIKLSQAV